MSATKKHIIQIDKIQILTADTKAILCENISVHIEADAVNTDELSQIIHWWFYWMGHIYFSRDLFHAKASYEGAIRLAINKELEKQNIVCTRVHIANVKQIHF